MSIEGNSRYEACFFDLYDTLVFFEAEEEHARVAEAAKLCGVRAEDYSAVWRDLVFESNLGRFPATENRVREALTMLGVNPMDQLVTALVTLEHKYLREKSKLYSDSLAVLTRLHNGGVRLGLVSNASPSVWEVIRSKNLDPLFECVVISSEIHIRKPEEGIYLEALRQLGLESPAALFVGDGNDRELDGAKAVGLTTVLVKRDDFRPYVFEQSTSASIDHVVNSLSEIPKLLGLKFMDS